VSGVVTADLHTHTTCSDGTLTPVELVQAVHAAGIRVLAITDHDTLAAYDDTEVMPLAETLGIRLVPGVEISADGAPGKCHLLALGIDPHHAELRETLATLSENRRSRNQRMVERLSVFLKTPLTWEEVVACAPLGANIGRPHFAACLLKRGDVQSIKEAFDRYLGDGKPGCVEKETLNPTDAIALTHRAGGKCFLAHPGLLRLYSHETYETRIRQLQQAGLDGIEAYYATYTPREEAKFVRLAEKLGLLTTGGSDFHGANKPGIELGRVRHGNPLDAALVYPFSTG
jgi:hypothetical protein